MEEGGGRRGTAVPSHIPHPNHAVRKNDFFFGTSLLKTQRSPGFGHEKWIIICLSPICCKLFFEMGTSQFGISAVLKWE
jgi:hypothetical protein